MPNTYLSELSQSSHSFGKWVQNNIKKKINVKRMHLHNRLFQLDIDLMQCDMQLKSINYIPYINQYIMP